MQITKNKAMVAYEECQITLMNRGKKKVTGLSANNIEQEIESVHRIILVQQKENNGGKKSTIQESL